VCVASALTLLRTLRAVLAAALHPLGDADGVEHASNDVIANARQILHTSPTNQNNRVFLEVVSDARDVGRDLDAVGQTNARNLTERRVRLLRCRRIDARADAALLRARLQSRRLGLVADLAAALTHELADRWHSSKNPLLRDTYS